MCVCVYVWVSVHAYVYALCIESYCYKHHLFYNIHVNSIPVQPSFLANVTGLTMNASISSDSIE